MQSGCAGGDATGAYGTFDQTTIMPPSVCSFLVRSFKRFQIVFVIALAESARNAEVL